MSDPFDQTQAGGSDQSNGFGGISPDTWRNLMAFGAQTVVAANARNGQGFLTYGPGAAGALGAGALAATDSAKSNATARSQLASQAANRSYLGAQTTGQNLENQSKAMQLPFQQAQQELRLRALQQLTGGQEGYNPQASNTPTAPISNPNGDAFTNAPYALKPAILAASADTGVPPHVIAGQVGQESSYGTDKTAPNVMGILPATAANPGYGMAPADPAALAQNPDQAIMFGARYLARKGGAMGVTDWTNPQQIATGLTAYNGGGDPNYVANVAKRGVPELTGYMPQASANAQSQGGTSYQVASNGAVAPPQQSQTPSGPQSQPTAPQSGVGAQGQLPPQLQAMQSQASALYNRAQLMEQAGLPGADAVRSQAAALTKVVTDTTTKLLEPSDVRPGGMHINNVTGQVTMPPVTKQFVGPDGATYEGIFDAQTGAAAPGMMPRLVKPNPTVTSYQTKKGDDLATYETGITNNATNAVQQNALLEAQRQNVPNISMGKGAETVQSGKAWLLSIGSKVFGADAMPDLAKEVAAGEDLNKIGVALVSKATTAVSSRAAASEMQYLANGQPNMTMSPQGYNTVVDQLMGINDYQVAKAKALQDWKNGNPTAGISAHPTPEGFDTWFNQQTTPAAFTMMRMASTPDGMQRLTDIRAQMSQTPEGRKVLQGLVTHAKNAQTAGWFTPPSTDDSAPAPAPQQAPAQQQTPAFDAMGVLP